MGLASKLGTATHSAPPVTGAQPAQPAGPYGAPPTAPGAYGVAPSAPAFPTQPGVVQPGQQRPQGQQYAPQSQTGQYPSQQPGQYPPQQPGQYPPQQPGQYPPQQPSQYPQVQASQYPGQVPGQQAHYGQQAGAYGQQPAYGAPQGQGGGAHGAGPAVGPPAPGGGSAGFDHHTLHQKLQQLVTENRLQAFYPPQRLAQLTQVVGGRDVAGLGARWRLPREVTLDLVGLALYDIVIYVDDSGSMAFEEGGERIDDMKAVLGRTADAATLFDTDGIVVRFMNSPLEGNGIHSEAEASALIQQIKFSGTTPLGSNLDRKVLQPMVVSQARSGSMQKPVLVICITDGEPTGEPRDTVRQVVMNAKAQLQSTPYGPGAVAFQFAQVGKDAGATRFLSALDTDPAIGSMIDCTSYYEQEQEEYARKGINLDPSLYLVKLMVGGIDRSYDEGDEG